MIRLLSSALCAQGTVWDVRCFAVTGGLPSMSGQLCQSSDIGVIGGARDVTYCLGMLLDAGLVLMADTRTNAGIDNFSTFRKLHRLCDDPDRQIYAASAGSLSLTQAVISLLQEDQLAADTGDHSRSLSEAPTMFRAAQIVGEAVARVGETTGAALAARHIDHTVEILLGGRVGDGPLKLFLIYSIGNFIECTPEVPFLQIGETKYGRPILDRALRAGTPLPAAVKIGLLSFDSTMKSNLGVAHPIDVLALPADRSAPIITRRIEKDDPYYREITLRWAEILYGATLDLPDPRWAQEGPPGRLEAIRSRERGRAG
jgi:putative proteasome-type protease